MTVTPIDLAESRSPADPEHPVGDVAALEELRASLRRWAGDRGAGVARAQVDGTDPDAAARCWHDLLGLGMLGAHLPETVGGGGAGLPAAVAVLGELANALVPGPLLPTFLTGTLLAAGCDADPSGAAVAGHAALEALAGGARGAVAVATRWEVADGRLDADLGQVVGLPGAELIVVVTPELTVVLNGDDPALVVEPGVPLDPTRTVGTGRLRRWTIDPERILSLDLTDQVGELTATLVAAEAGGITQWCLDTAVRHARTREQFGRPIGTFQAVNHRCVDLLVARDRTAALAEAAAGGGRHAVAAAGLLAPTAAVAAANGCIQLLGAVGFTWEHDAHLRLRRALASRSMLAPAALWQARMLSAFRAEPVDVDMVRVEPSEPLRRRAAAIAAAAGSEQRRALADSGLLAPSLSAPWGMDATPREQAAVRTALRDAGVAIPDLVVGTWALATLTAAGTPEQCARFVPPTLRGELAWCQLFSEPEAGSDLAALRTRAEPIDGGWAITGHKIWTSRATEADWAICLARVPDAGVTYFLVPMDDDRVRVEPLRNLTGSARFAEVFLDGIVVTSGEVIGAVGDGWRVARTTLGSERLQMSDTRFGIDLCEIVRLLDASEDRVLHEAGVGALIADGIALQAMTARDLDGRTDSSPEVRKLVSMAYYQRTADLAHVLIGADGAAASRIADQVLDTRGLTIGGGTTEVLATAIGERVLGLPRASRRG